MKDITVNLTIDQWQLPDTEDALLNLDRYYEMDLAQRLRDRIANLDNVKAEDLEQEIEELYLEADSLYDQLEESQAIFENSQINEIVRETIEQSRNQ